MTTLKALYEEFERQPDKPEGSRVAFYAGALAAIALSKERLGDFAEEMLKEVEK